MLLAGYFITQDSFFTTVNTKSRTAISLWFAGKITKSAIVYLLSYWRDAINFPFLIQATNGNISTAPLNGKNDPWQNKYTVQEQTMAGRMLHIMKLKCSNMVTNAWLYILDNVEDDVKSFPVRKDLLAGAIAAFKSSRCHLDMTQIWWTPMEEWPVHLDMRFRKKKATVSTSKGSPSILIS